MNIIVYIWTRYNQTLSIVHILPLLLKSKIASERLPSKLWLDRKKFIPRYFIPDVQNLLVNFAVAGTHKETKQFFTLYNTLDDTKLYLGKEVSFRKFSIKDVTFLIENYFARILTTQRGWIKQKIGWTWQYKNRTHRFFLYCSVTAFLTFTICFSRSTYWIPSMITLNSKLARFCTYKYFLYWRRKCLFAAGQLRGTKRNKNVLVQDKERAYIFWNSTF